MNGAARGRKHARSLYAPLVLAMALPVIAWSQSPPGDGDFIYRARPRDTLIGISRRLLTEPRRWSEVQARNNIADPRRIPLGTEIRIPYSWLRLTPDLATVSVVSGEVRQKARKLAAGDTLPEGSQILTGHEGSVTLTLADGSVITLQKSTVLTLEGMRHVTGLPEAHDTRLKLQSGRMQTVAKPQANVGRFEIRTPVAVSAVRGTQFRSAFEPSAENATTETLEGLVGVSGSSAVVSVPANFGTRIERGAAPLPPIQLLPPPDLQALPGTNGASRLQLQWPPVPGATSYRVQLAPEVEFHSFLVDTESSTPQLDVPAPADGDYWLRVRSIDRFGLEGPDAVKPLVQHLLPAAPALAAPLVDASVVGDRATFAWTDPAPGNRYRVQIARDANFADLLSERDAGETAQVEIDQIPPGRYFWRVAAVNARGESGDWSPAQAYTQRRRAPIPDAPTFAGNEMRLAWESQDGVRYRIQIARDPEFKAALIDETLDAASLATRRPRPGTYYARVQTIAADGSTTPFGETRSFEVPVPLWLKILLPLAALLTVV